LYYKDDFIKFFIEKDENLINFNYELLMLLFEMLGIDCKVEFTTKFIKYYDENYIDKRNIISPKHNINCYENFLLTPRFSILNMDLFQT